MRLFPVTEKNATVLPVGSCCKTGSIRAIFSLKTRSASSALPSSSPMNLIHSIRARGPLS